MILLKNEKKLKTPIYKLTMSEVVTSTAKRGILKAKSMTEVKL